MVCPKCGSQIQDGLTNCPVCNEVLVVQNANIQSLESANELSESPTVKSKYISKYKNTIIGVVGVIVFIVIGYLVFLSPKNKEVNLDKDIPTINKEETTTSKKRGTTTTSKKIEEVENQVTESGEVVKIKSYSYTVPIGFQFKEKEEGEEYDYYLLRTKANALIGLTFIESEESLLDVYNKALLSYEEKGIKTDTTSSEPKYEDYKYYRLSVYDQEDRKNVKLHTNLIIELASGEYVNVYLYEPVSYGEQNYYESLFKFLKSRK